MEHKIVIRSEGVDNQGLSFLQDKVITELMAIRQYYFRRNGFLFNNVYMSPTVVNLLAYSPLFFHESDYNNSNIDDSSIYYVGSISDVKVYSDLYIHRNKFKMTIDKNKLREYKINNIIGEDLLDMVYEIFVTIDSDLI